VQEVLEVGFEESEEVRERRAGARNILAIEVAKPPILPTKFSPSLNTPYYYRLLQEHRYEKPPAVISVMVFAAYLVRGRLFIELGTPYHRS
jgi:hypothetical protein